MRVLAALCVAFAASPVLAQAPADTLGASVRVWVREASPRRSTLLIGRIGARSPDTLTIAFGRGDSVRAAVPRSLVQRLDVARERTRWNGAQVGLRDGLLVSPLVLGAMLGIGEASGQTSRRTALWAVPGVIVASAVYGAASRAVRWRRVTPK